VNIPFKYTYCVIYCTYTFCIFLCSLVVRPLFIEFFGVRSEFNFWFSLASFVLRPFFGRTYHCVFLTSSTCFRPVQKQFSTASRPLKKISHRFVTALIEFLAVPSLFVPFSVLCSQLVALCFFIVGKYFLWCSDMTFRLFLACSFPFSKCFKIIFHSHKFAAFAQLVDNFIICQKIKQVCIGIFDDFIYHTVYAPTFISSLKFWK